jgi:hypothetical protein
VKSLTKIETTASKSEGTRRHRTRLTKQELILQPWFLPKRVARNVWALVPPDYRKRLHDYFDDYGCMRCNRLDVAYRSNAMCDKCMMLVYHRLQQSINRRSADRPPRGYGRELVRKAALARKLLSEFSCEVKASPKAARLRSVRLSSPIIETY